MRIEKPQWLRDFLSTLHWSFVLPIVNWEIWIDAGYGLELGIDWIVNAVNAFFDTIFFVLHSLLDRWEIIDANINSLWRVIWEQADRVWRDAINLFNSIRSEIDSRLADLRLEIYYAKESVRLDVESFVRTQVSPLWTAIDQRISDLRTWADQNITSRLSAAVSPLRRDINTLIVFRNHIEAFFNDPWGWLYAQFDSFIERFW